MLDDLAKAMDVAGDSNGPGQPPRETIVRIGRVAIKRNLQQRGLTPPDTDDIAELITYSAGAVLDDLEAKLGIETKTDASLIDRVRATRRVIHDVRTDEGRVADHAAALTWADQAMLAFRIASYLPDYVAEKPTLDRVSETIEKIAEDVHRKMIDPIGGRRAYVRFNDPIPLDSYIAEGKRGKQAIRELTADCEAAVQNGLDKINTSNPHVGGKLYDKLSA